MYKEKEAIEIVSIQRGLKHFQNSIKLKNLLLQVN